MNEIILDEVYDIRLSSFWKTLPGYASIALLCLAALLFIYGMVKFLKYYRRASTKERTLKNLKMLAERVQKGSFDTRKIYQEMTNLIKQYAVWRYDLPKGSTDYELTVLLKGSECKAEHCETVSRIIEDAQVVKFGKVTVLKQQVLLDIAEATSFVELTGSKKDKGAR